MSKHKISGKVVFLPLSGGCWGIVDQQGREWRPVNMPDQIKLEGRHVEVVVKEVEEDVSIFMWGTPVKIVSYHTLNP